MSKEKYEADSMDDLIGQVIPEGCDLYTKDTKFDHETTHCQIAVRAINRSSNEQHFVNVYHVLESDKWTCGPINTTALPKDAKRLTKGLKGYSEYGDTVPAEAEEEVAAQ